jgi:SAM-dependent methyltransferase
MLIGSKKHGHDRRSHMQESWSPEQVLEMARSFQPAAVLTAGADLDIFTVLKDGPADASTVAARAGSDRRAVAVLLDALAALKLLSKDGAGRYVLAAGVADCLTAGAPGSVLAMVRHQGNCMRRWDQLAEVAKSGSPAQRTPSVRGPEGDLQSFIMAMDELSVPMAPGLLAAIDPPGFKRFLDVGGASGTWTIAFLRAAPSGRAVIFDLPDVIALARRRLTEAGLLDRVDLVPGDFYEDPLPPGCDLVWLGAIVHQNSREENRALFRKVLTALAPGGQVAIRDIVMDPSRTRPPMGALFAVNMLVGTRGGGTYTFDELREDLQAMGYTDAKLLRWGEVMDSIVTARKPSPAPAPRPS